VRDVRKAVRGDGGEVVGFEGVVTPLGGAAAYSALETRLAEILPASGALFCLDVTRFRDVTELLGHRVGEDLIHQLEARLSRRLPMGAVFGHAGGSQFACFVAGLGLREAEELATALLETIEQPFLLNGVDMFASAHIGIALSPEHGSTVAELTRSADAALYLARNKNRPGYTLYSTDAGAEVRNRAELAVDLRRALDRRELELFYQPQVTLSADVRAMEALLRWRHPTKGLLVPGQFIDIAEETGLIVPIGGWVVEEACRRCKMWNQDRRRQIKVCVNVSALQFYFSDLADVVRGALDRTGLPAQLLELELTETLLLRDTWKCTQDLEEIRKLGVTIAIDDFGTGYSSLSYLRKLPVDVVKIDRSYVADLHPGGMPALVGAITAMAHGLGLQVVAEGIERTDQMEILRGLSVDLVQGYLFGRPKRLNEADPV
jgi:diguanylate cyclase (GGDEF)-like protein